MIGRRPTPLHRLPTGPVDLPRLATDATPGFDGGKAGGQGGAARDGGRARRPPGAAVRRGRAIGSRRRVLLVLQGMDTSGKGGTLRHTVGTGRPPGRPDHVVQGTDRGGARPRLPVAGPPGGARARLPRRLRPLPLRGRADGRVDELAPADEIERRYDAINDFERELVDDGTVVLKCMLHISPQTQKERLLARLDNPEKHWKYDPGDLDARARWEAYRAAYVGRAGAHEHRARAVARRAERPQVVPQPGRRPAAARRAAGHGPGRGRRRDFDVAAERARLLGERPSA